MIQLLQTGLKPTFSSLTLTGGCLPSHATLHRRTTFPTYQKDMATFGQIRRPDWGAAPIPVEGEHLQLKLGASIGFGRTAVVYEAEVIGESSLPKLCVKIARHNRCRTLAREGWVYERLQEGVHQGVTTPRYYGFFSTEVTADWIRSFWASEVFHLPADDWESVDISCDGYLPGDGGRVAPSGGETVAEVCPRDSSEWVDWKPDFAAPLLCVLVMTQGGAQYTMEDDVDVAAQCVHTPQLRV